MIWAMAPKVPGGVWGGRGERPPRGRKFFNCKGLQVHFQTIFLRFLSKEKRMKFMVSTYYIWLLSITDILFHVLQTFETSFHCEFLLYLSC